MYYKVVRNVGGQYYSAQISGGQFEVEYLPGQFVQAQVGNLFLFKTKAAAEAFIGPSAGNLEIWECEVKNVSQPTAVLQDSLVIQAGTRGIGYLDAFREFWRTLRAVGGRITMSQERVRYLRAPEGTLLAEEISLIQPV